MQEGTRTTRSPREVCTNRWSDSSVGEFDEAKRQGREEGVEMSQKAKIGPFFLLVPVPTDWIWHARYEKRNSDGRTQQEESLGAEG